MNFLETFSEKLPLLEERIGYIFANKNLLLLAFTHRSFVNENKSLGSLHNERIEFLGDSVLGLIAADFLYHRLPNISEGPLSQLRSRIVDAQACARYLQKLELPEFILLGRGEALSDGKAKMSILADAFEALIGAIYIDGGFSSAKSFFLCHFEQDMESVIDSPSRNYKAELQDYFQKKKQKIPVYKVVQETGPDHAKVFHVVVAIGEQELGLGLGESKKQAEQNAAFDALSKLRSDE